MDSCSVPVLEHSRWLLNHHVKTECSAATAATSEAKYIQGSFPGLWTAYVNIHLSSDSSGAIGVASKRGLQRLRHLDVRFLWLLGETAAKRVRISKVPGPENVADANAKHADKRSLEFCRMSLGVLADPETVS